MMDFLPLLTDEWAVVAEGFANAELMIVFEGRWLPMEILVVFALNESPQFWVSFEYGCQADVWVA